jgi:hypothetical protein
MEGTEPVLAKPMAPPPKVTVPRIKDVVARGLDVAAYGRERLMSVDLRPAESPVLRRVIEPQ